MKRLLVLCLTVALFFVCFTACDEFEHKPGYDPSLKCDKYENCAVFTFDDFPIRENASFELDRTGLDEGAIYYQVNLVEGALEINYKESGLIHNEQPLGGFSADDEMPMSGSGGYVEGDKITISFYSHSPVSGEIIIAFTESALKTVHGDLQLHQHTYSYTSAGKEGHYTTSTCGCPSEEGTTPHYDGNTDYLCDFCKCDMTEFAVEWQYDETHHWYVSDDNAVCCYSEHENWDADLICDICGFNMSEIPTPTNHFLRNQAGCEWLNELVAEDIAEIKIIDEAVGVAPGTPKNISTTTDEAVIARIFEEYYWLDTAPISKENGQIDGGGAVTVKFILKDGTKKELYINNGNYLDTNGNFFELLYTPKFKNTDNKAETYGFITYTGMGRLSTCDPIGMEPQYVCMIPMDELEFVITGYDFSLFDNGYDYCINSEFGKLYFTKVEVFASEGDDNKLVRVDYYFIIENDKEFCYRLVGKGLEELISDAAAQRYSLTMNDEEWLYEDLQPTYKAGETVSVKIGVAYDLGYMLFVNGKRVMDEKHTDGPYWEFVFTMPESDVVIDFKTYDGFLPNANYAVLYETFWTQNLDADYVSIRHYYGEFASGAIVSMIDCADCTEALWDEIIDDVVIHYNNGNRIIVLYEGEFYTLINAYNNGYITGEDLIDISQKHALFYPYLYE